MSHKNLIIDNMTRGTVVHLAMFARTVVESALTGLGNPRLNKMAAAQTAAYLRDVAKGAKLASTWVGKAPVADDTTVRYVLMIQPIKSAAGDMSPLEIEALCLRLADTIGNVGTSELDAKARGDLLLADEIFRNLLSFVLGLDSKQIPARGQSFMPAHEITDRMRQGNLHHEAQGLDASHNPQAQFYHQRGSN